MSKITNIEFLRILNSGGKSAIKSKIVIDDKYIGEASAPSAILPGKREVNTSSYGIVENKLVSKLKEELLKINDINQEKVDTILNENISNIGSDICLSLSLAFARSISKRNNQTLVEYIEELTKIKSNYKSPHPLIGIFSGGVHGKEKVGTIQQIFISVNCDIFSKSVDIITKIYNDVENYLRENEKYYDLGASSGLVVKNMTPDEEFKLLIDTIKKYNLENIVSVGIDVAAEHLYDGNNYYYNGNVYNQQQFYNLICKYQENYNITFVEDPFDTDDTTNWQKFKKEHKNIDVVGDDIFATQSEFLNDTFANAIIIKMNQAGTLTNTLKTVIKARKNNFKLCVSHRSYETEDTFMCDLAVAINSDYIKIGGPKRTDRTVKYNRLLELSK